MRIVGVVGSPRKEGLTNKLMEAALRGAESQGAEVQKVYLVDYDIRIYKAGQGIGGDQPGCPKGLSALCNAADGLVLGSPVYWGDVSGLTKAFMDSVETDDANGKSALGFAVAGGTGKGLISGVQSIYHFFFHRQFRGISPTPVCRFNFEEALTLLEKGGAQLAQASQERSKFPGSTADERWPAAAAHYVGLEHVGRDIFDEFVLLTKSLVKVSEGEKAREAEANIQKAVELFEKGRKTEAAVLVVEAYQALFYPP